MILQFCSTILILIHYNDLDLEIMEITTWRSLDLIEILLYLADSGHSMQVWDDRSSLLRSSH